MMQTQNNPTIQSRSIFLNGLSPKASLFELLVALDNLFKTEGKLSIDLRGTKIILVKSISCVHCGRQRALYKPLSQYVPEEFRCEACADICAHGAESNLPSIKTVTQYSFRSPKTILELSLETLGLLPDVCFYVIDPLGESHPIQLKY